MAPVEELEQGRTQVLDPLFHVLSQSQLAAREPATELRSRLREAIHMADLPLASKQDDRCFHLCRR